MSDQEDLGGPQAQSSAVQPSTNPAPSAPAASSGEKLDSIEDIDFLLEEVENKIAPLALA